MAYIWNREIKEDTIENRLRNAINLGRREALKEVLKWLEENFYTVYCLHDEYLTGEFVNAEEMIYSFKQKFELLNR